MTLSSIGSNTNKIRFVIFIRDFNDVRFTPKTNAVFANMLFIHMYLYIYIYANGQGNLKNRNAHVNIAFVRMTSSKKKCLIISKSESLIRKRVVG